MCAHLGIPHYVVDLAAEFGAAVVDDFVEAYLAGETPNPCVKCNQHIKFTPLLARARAIGADVLVTGHYAQHRRRRRSARAASTPARTSRTSCSRCRPPSCAAVRFPLGGLTKDEVRAHALRLGLPNAAKPESQEICFVPDGDYAGFVSAQALRRGRALPGAGAIVDDERRACVGRHDGVAPLHGRPAPRPRQPDHAATSCTSPRSIRRAPRSASARARPPSARELAIRDLRWLSRAARPRCRAHVQVRHRGAPIAAEIDVDGDRAARSPRRADRRRARPGRRDLRRRSRPRRRLGSGILRREVAVAPARPLTDALARRDRRRRRMHADPTSAVS